MRRISSKGPRTDTVSDAPSNSGHATPRQHRTISHISQLPGSQRGRASHSARFVHNVTQGATPNTAFHSGRALRCSNPMIAEEEDVRVLRQDMGVCHMV